MNPLRTLRGRLAGAMLAIFLLALVTSAMLDQPARPRAGRVADPAPARSFVLISEPYQDGLVLASFSAAALILIWLVSSWSLRPLARASREAQSVGPLAPAARLSRAGLPAEITPLVDAVNGALDRMAEAFAAERRFTENAAHELRTPLAVLGLRLQRARNEPTQIDWPAIDQDMAHINRLVSQLLNLARQENTARTEAGTGFKPVNLSRIAREAAAMILPLLETQNRAIVVDLPEATTIRGQPDDLRDALGSLLENAALHGKGTITLHARTTTDPTETIVTVSDEGPGVPAGLEETMFQRFQKGSHSEGTGLGLAIVREVARIHGGDVKFLPGAPGRVVLRVPGGGGEA